ncbi:armadillo-type protein [Bipolaris maydis]|nr:armadillo-type protein [Bipolaris maydis]
MQQILDGLDRYNPETTSVFQDYVMQQCENQTYDCYANLALLKLYQFNPHLARDETITNILVKALTVFPSPDFSLGLSLLPPHVLAPLSSSHTTQQLAMPPLSEAELMRVRIAATVSQAIREVDRSILESWLNLSGSEFDHFVGSVCGWNVDGAKIKVPINKDNEAKGTVVRENVKFDQFARVIKRAYEQPA